jgi:putative transposase
VGALSPSSALLQPSWGLGAPTPKLKGWYSRGYLPHCDAGQILQSITFRLADALPQDKFDQLARELAAMPDAAQDAVRRRRIEQWMDAGMGCCALHHPQMAALMQETLQKFDGERYRLIAWCVMPNHVHVLIEPLASLPKIVQSWKSFTGRWALLHNAELGLGVPVPHFGRHFWMRDYWDRYIRDERHLHAVIHYIHDNPVTAGLCPTAPDWPWSSAKVQA